MRFSDEQIAKITKTALRFTTLAAFKEAFPMEYMVYSQRGILGKICGHMKVDCPICKKSFTPKYISTKACSLVCRRKHYNKISCSRRAIPQKNRECIICSKDFKKRHPNHQCCSKECMMENARRRARKWCKEKRIYKLPKNRKCKICKTKIPAKNTKTYCDTPECKLQGNRNRNKKYYRSLLEKGGETYTDRIKKDPVKWKIHCDKVNKRFKDRIKSDIQFKLKYVLRGRLRFALKAQNTGKTYKAELLLGCSITEFKEYISCKFRPGMSWDNHGSWHLDHIKPCISFDLKKISQQKKCFHYSNYQPLWKRDNLLKNASLDWVLNESV